MLRVLPCLALFTAILLSGCGPGGVPSNVPASNEEGKPAPAVGPSAEGKKFLLDQEPDRVRGVLAVRKEVKDGEAVVVAGRVGGSSKPFTEGRASFLIVDPSLKPTEECDCPWDYCEYPKKELAAARLLVKFVDAGGKTLPRDARKLFGLQELSPVVVQGKLRRDEKDNLIVEATGLFVRPTTAGQ